MPPVSTIRDALSLVIREYENQHLHDKISVVNDVRQLFQESSDLNDNALLLKLQKLYVNWCRYNLQYGDREKETSTVAIIDDVKKIIVDNAASALTHLKPKDLAEGLTIPENEKHVERLTNALHNAIVPFAEQLQSRDKLENHPYWFCMENYMLIGQVLKVVSTYELVDNMLEKLLYRILTEKTLTERIHEEEPNGTFVLDSSSILSILQHFEEFNHFREENSLLRIDKAALGRLYCAVMVHWHKPLIFQPGA